MQRIPRRSGARNRSASTEARALSFAQLMRPAHVGGPEAMREDFRGVEVRLWAPEVWCGVPSFGLVFPCSSSSWGLVGAAGAARDREESGGFLIDGGQPEMRRGQPTGFGKPHSGAARFVRRAAAGGRAEDARGHRGDAACGVKAAPRTRPRARARSRSDAGSDARSDLPASEASRGARRARARMRARGGHDRRHDCSRRPPRHKDRPKERRAADAPVLRGGRHAAAAPF